MRKKGLLVVLVFMVVYLFTLGCEASGTAKYTITFNTGVSGVTVSAVTKEAGEPIAAPNNPAREGYRFDGWSLNGSAYIFSVMPDSNITLEAMWSKYYKITFNTGEDATQVAERCFVVGEKISAIETPTRPHYLFNGWTLNAAPYIVDTMPENNLTLVASWVAAVMISFNTLEPSFTVNPIIDVAGADVKAPTVNRPGYRLLSWKLGGSDYVFAKMPTADIELTAVWLKLSNLPTLFINLKNDMGGTFPLDRVDRENYIKSDISLNNAPDGQTFESVAADFRGRGNGSWGEAKKGYRIKFKTKQSMLGEPASKSWVIIACTNFNDRTLSKNSMAYNITRDVFTNIEYASSAKWTDIYINGTYHGVYVLCEQVSVGNDRVDIDSQYGIDDTGYLIEYDAYANLDGQADINYFTIPNVKYPFTIKSPDPDDFVAEGSNLAEYKAQVRFIREYTSKTYKAALDRNFKTFEQYADVNSFVDMYILHEYFKNTDTGYSSFYLYKKAGGKLYAGPPWDFDASAGASRGDGRATTPQGIYVSDAVQRDSPTTASEIFIALMKTAEFKNLVKARWIELSPSIKNFVESTLSSRFMADNKAAMGRNFVKWSGLSQSTAETNWVNDVTALRKWLLDRVVWLNGEWK